MKDFWYENIWDYKHGIGIAITLQGCVTQIFDRSHTGFSGLRFYLDLNFYILWT